MKKTQAGLLLSLSLFVLSILFTPPFTQHAQTATPQANVGGGTVFVTNQNDGGTATRQLATDAAAPYSEAQSQAERNASLHGISSHDVASRSADHAAAKRNGLFLILRGTSQLEQFPQAKAAIQRAAARWETLIQDQISVIVDVDFGPTYFGQSFQSPSAAAVTNVQNLLVGSSSFYALILQDMRDKPTDFRQGLIFGALPDGAIPTDVGDAEILTCATPIARAIGKLNADADPNAEARTLTALPSIGFNSNVKFDFDSSDGVDPDKLDFETLALREFGRILGFTSNAGVGETEPSKKAYATVWDFFRFRPGVTFEDINRAKRAMLSGNEHVYFAGGEELPLSTGKSDGTGGDGNPAGHWKDDALTGRYIGIMDPTLAFGERGGVTAYDLDAIHFMGYQLPIDAPVVEILSADDNSREDTVKLNGAMAVTRLTPSRYPGELQAIRLQLPPPADGSSLAGTQLRVVAFVDAARAGRPQASPQFLFDRTVTIGSLPENRMLEVVIPNAPVINGGDIYVGAQSSSSKLAIGADGSSTQQRSFLSTDNGASFQLLQTGARSPLNLIARAMVTGRIENNAVAAVNSVSPSSVLAGTQVVTITVYGNNFSYYAPFSNVFNSVVRWNGQPRETTYINGNALQAQIPAKDIAQVGTARITVFTPTLEGGLESAPLEIKIATENPKPVIARISPDEASVGGGQFDLSVYGRDFAANSLVLWNGAIRPTQPVNSTQLTIPVSAADLANAANVEVTVMTPSPGGGTSNALRLPVAPCRYGLTQVNKAFSSLGGTAGVLISTGRQCQWNVGPGESWFSLSAVSQPRGAGRSLYSYYIRGNEAAAPRIGNLAIAGQTVAVKQVGRATGVSAANFIGSLAPESIGAVFGLSLAAATQTVATNPLPVNVAETEVRIIDNKGDLRLAPLFYVSPTQINFLVPKGIAFDESQAAFGGTSGKVSVFTKGELVADGTISMATVAPALFTPNADGLGPPSGVALRVKADGSQSYEPIADYDPVRKRFVTRPIDLGDESDKVYLVVFGTGIRGRTSLSAVSVKLAEVDAQVLYAGPQGGFAGLDQINLLLPRSLKGRGEVRLLVTVNGKPTQAKVAFQ